MSRDAGDAGRGGTRVTPQELLAGICSGESDDVATSITRAPFCIEWQGAPWTVATDGKRLLMIAGGGPPDPERADATTSGD